MTHYLRPLVNTQVAFRVKQRRPKTVNEAVAATQEMEAYFGPSNTSWHAVLRQCSYWKMQPQKLDLFNSSPVTRQSGCNSLPSALITELELESGEQARSRWWYKSTYMLEMWQGRSLCERLRCAEDLPKPGKLATLGAKGRACESKVSTMVYDKYYLTGVVNSIPVTFLLRHLTAEAIFGLNFLRDNGCIVDTAKVCMNFPNRAVSLSFMAPVTTTMTTSVTTPVASIQVTLKTVFVLALSELDVGGLVSGPLPLSTDT